MTKCQITYKSLQKVSEFPKGLALSHFKSGPVKKNTLYACSLISWIEQIRSAAIVNISKWLGGQNTKYALSKKRFLGLGSFQSYSFDCKKKFKILSEGECQNKFKVFFQQSGCNCNFYLSIQPKNMALI